MKGDARPPPPLLAVEGGRSVDAKESGSGRALTKRMRGHCRFSWIRREDGVQTLKRAAAAALHPCCVPAARGGERPPPPLLAAEG